MTDYYSNLSPADFTVGDTIYECQSGLNIKVEVTSRPEYVLETSFGTERKYWTWSGKNVYSGEAIAYALTEGLEHYGPRLYSEPQYVTVTGGEVAYRFIGDEDD